MPSFFEWRFVVETSKDQGKTWTYSESPFEDEQQAINYAKSLGPTVSKRVRQFKTTIFRAGQDETVSGAGARDYIGSETVPIIPWFCLTHPTQTANALETSAPRCKECRQLMFQGIPGDLG